MRFLKSYAPLKLLLCSACLFSSSIQAQVNEQEVDYVIARYLAAMGGRASLEQILSVRLSGYIVYPNGIKHNVTVLKKKPNLVRIVLDTGTVRFVQAYNGDYAWFSREAGRNIFHDRMRGQLAESFIREAPLEGVLVNPLYGRATHSLGPDVTVAKVPCFQVISAFSDGSKTIHYIDKDAFLERRILQYDQEGTLISEMVPGKFEMVNGVLFSKQIVRMQDGAATSTLVLNEVETNVGILDTPFSPPVEIPGD